MAGLRVVYMGTPDFAVPCLDKLVASNCAVAAVVTQPDRPKGRGQKLTPSPVKEAALRYGLPVLQPEKIRTPEFLAHMADLRPDVIVVVAYGQFLPAGLLSLPRCGCVNVHASLLPRYRGAAPIHWAVINGEKVTGVTTMYMDIGMDTGDIIIAEETAIGPDETTGELHDRLMVMGADLLDQTMGRLAAGSAPRRPQDPALATYAPLLDREVERIDWQQPAAVVHNLVRGLCPWPGAYCRQGEKVVKVWRTELMADGPAGSPGQVVELGPTGPVVATRAGAVRLLEVQPENRRRISAGEYGRGYGLSTGDMFQ